jgi:apolipoprotein N-acyltransferase
VLAFPPADVSFVAWAALVPLFLAARGGSPRAAFWLGYLWGLVAYGGILWWMTAFGPAVWILITLLTAVFPGVATLAIAWVERDYEGPWAFLAVAVVWTGAEFLRSQGPIGFPWALLGASQHRVLPVIQVVSFTGVYGVTFLVVLANAALTVLLARRGVAAPLVGAGLALGAAVLWGLFALRQPIPASFTAAVVQPNFSNRVERTPDLVAQQLSELGYLTHEAAARGATLVVWPETASPTDIVGNPPVLAAIRSWVRADRISLIASSLEGGSTNSAFAFGPAGTLTGRYDKVRLVPFAEAGEKRGRDYTVLTAPPARLGVAICFESIFPQIARRYVRGGATMLAVITNDAWFAGRAAPAQHAALAPFRAVEEGRYLLRAGNQELSAIIDPRGRVLGDLPLRARGILIARVAPLSGLTPYARYGDLFGWACVLTVVGLLLPRALGFIARQARIPAFSGLLVYSALPLLALMAAGWLRGPSALALGRAMLPLPVLALLAVIGALSLGHRARDLGFRAAGFIPALALSVGGVVALALVARHAFAAQGSALVLPVPPGGWWAGAAVQIVVVGLALEWWLRGLVFATAARWSGWRLAVVWSALLGTLAGVPRGPEAMVWGLCVGLILGLIRARWAQVPALAIAHGTGNVLLGFLISPW